MTVTKPTSESEKYRNITGHLPAWTERIADTHGLTVNVSNNDQPTDGWVVGGYGDEWIVPAGQFTEEVLGNFVREHYETLTSGAYYLLGVWVDLPNLGTAAVHLDVSVVFNSRVMARIEAEANRQLAFYDLSTGDVIQTARGVAGSL